MLQVLGMIQPFNCSPFVCELWHLIATCSGGKASLCKKIEMKILVEATGRGEGSSSLGDDLIGRGEVPLWPPAVSSFVPGSQAVLGDWSQSKAAEMLSASR